MVHTARFGESGGGVQHGIVERALGDYLDGFAAVDDTPLFGYGLGIGTNAGAGMLSGGARSFLLAEGEWARVVKETGPVLGLGYLFLRVGMVFYIGWIANSAFGRKNPLPLIIFSACFLLVTGGQFGQPTALGFAVFGAGLCLAAVNEEIVEDPNRLIFQEPVRGMRGRSVFAERLHRE